MQTETQKGANGEKGRRRKKEKTRQERDKKERGENNTEGRHWCIQTGEVARVPMLLRVTWVPKEGSAS